MPDLKITGKKGITEAGGVSASFLLAGIIVLCLKKRGIETDVETAVAAIGVITAVISSIIRMLANYKKHK